jgi:two-component system sensor histidine kinase/response regulator
VFHLEKVLKNLSNVVTLKAEEKGLEILFDIGTDVPCALRGDSLRLEQVKPKPGHGNSGFNRDRH